MCWELVERLEREPWHNTLANALSKPMANSPRTRRTRPAKTWAGMSMLVCFETFLNEYYVLDSHTAKKAATLYMYRSR